jgi:hypothetical protein
MLNLKTSFSEAGKKSEVKVFAYFVIDVFVPKNNDF